ncbi:hypothetical protein H4219_005448 [Mycoemilia scoparia]|uniref:Uncharacterized protein n=1 Tax=Mycoemilia scoparia TaxID=417184 RepID=A0A9W8DPA4_9FUNG|nr:hypothetical protein H4219_005448 [Mycoemilia scoparia]
MARFMVQNIFSKDKLELFTKFDSKQKYGEQDIGDLEATILQTYHSIANSTYSVEMYFSTLYWIVTTVMRYMLLLLYQNSNLPAIPSFGIKLNLDYENMS